MTHEVISVRPDTSTQKAAQRLLKAEINACPAIDDSSGPVGLVCDDNLIGRDELDREAAATGGCRCWRNASRSTRVSSIACAHPSSARDVMSGPVVTATEHTNLAEFARL